MDSDKVEGQPLSRRGLAKAAAWGAPAVVMMGAAPCVGASTVDVPENPFGKGWVYVDQRNVGTIAALAEGDFHYLFPSNGKSITVPEMEWTVKVIPVPNDEGKLNTANREVYVQEYVTSNLDSAVAFNKTTPVSGSNGKFIPGNINGKRNADGSYTVTFTTPEVTDSRGNQVRSYGFKVYTGYTDIFNRRADKVVVEGRPKNGVKGPDGKPVCKPGTQEPMDLLWVDYDSVRDASPDKRFGQPGWSYAQDGRV
ncbi:hypothetical protein ACUH97_05210 [Dermabacteraceae bacterium P13088]